MKKRSIDKTTPNQIQEGKLYTVLHWVNQPQYVYRVIEKIDGVLYLTDTKGFATSSIDMRYPHFCHVVETKPLQDLVEEVIMELEDLQNIDAELEYAVSYMNKYCRDKFIFSHFKEFIGNLNKVKKPVLQGIVQNAVIKLETYYKYK